jgi:stress response protein YsnF
MNANEPENPAPPLADTVHVSEETVRVDKVQRETGRVRVSVTTDSVEDYISDTLQSKAARVERVEIGKEVSIPPQMREEDGVLIIPVLEEILVVEKRLFLKEEIRLHFTSTHETFHEKVQRRVQRAVVERIESNDPDQPPAGT